jgi:hypothetical protein
VNADYTQAMNELQASLAQLPFPVRVVRLSESEVNLVLELMQGQRDLVTWKRVLLDRSDLAIALAEVWEQVPGVGETWGLEYTWVIRGLIARGEDINSLITKDPERLHHLVCSGHYPTQYRPPSRASVRALREWWVQATAERGENE